MSGVVSLVDLLRHGQTDGGSGFRGSTDDGLTALGMEQMWRATSGEREWQCIVTSPLRRCAEFASALAERLHTPLMIDDRLREIHFGAWEAHRAGEISRLDPDGLQRFWADPLRHPPPGAEPLTAFEARVLSCWEDRLRGHAGGRVLMVTHGGPIRAILGHVYGVPWTDLLGLDLPHASLTHVRVERVRNGIAHAGVVAAPNSA